MFINIVPRRVTTHKKRKREKNMTKVNYPRCGHANNYKLEGTNAGFSTRKCGNCKRPFKVKVPEQVDRDTPAIRKRLSGLETQCRQLDEQCDFLHEEMREMRGKWDKFQEESLKNLLILARIIARLITKKIVQKIRNIMETDISSPSKPPIKKQAPFYT